MNIALIATGNPNIDDFPDPSYGTTIQIWGMAEYFADLGHKTTIYAGSKENRETCTYSNVDVKYFPSRMPDRTINGIFSRLLFSKRVTEACTSHETDLLLARERISAVFPLRSGIRSIYTVISPDSFDFFLNNRSLNPLQRIFVRYKKLIEYHNLKRADQVTVINRHMVDYLSDKGISNVHYTPIGIPSSQIVDYSNRCEEEFIMYAGRLDYNKRVDWLLKSYSDIQDLGMVLKIIGDGPEEESLRKLSRDLGIRERVDFCGRLPREEVLSDMRKAAIKVLPSKFEEGGNVVLEALASGCPVIASRTRGPSSMINHGETGLLFDRESRESLTEHLRDLCSNPQERTRLGRNGLAFIRENQSMDKVSERYLSIAREIE